MGGAGDGGRTVPTHFKYLDVSLLPPFEDAFVGTIRPGISDERELLIAVADALRFPSYFGENYNALYDCLRDLQWIDTRKIVLVHVDLPQISADGLKVYLEILRDSASDWEFDAERELVVVFDASKEGLIERALGLEGMTMPAGHFKGS